MGVVGVGAAIDQPQLAFGQQHRAVADIGIFGDAALEARSAGRDGADFADQVEPRDPAVRLFAGRRHHRLLADIGDQADEHGFAGHHAHEFSDGWAFAAGDARDEFDGGLRAGDGRDAADQFGAGSCWRTCALCSGSVHGSPRLEPSLHFLRNRRAVDLDITGR